MLGKGLDVVGRFLPKKVNVQRLIFNSTSAAASEPKNEEKPDPGPLFFNKEVQRMLMTITRPSDEIIFKRRLDGSSLQAPVYKFMTDEDLEKARRIADYKRRRLLQMPPVVKERGESGQIIDRDIGLDGYDDAKTVFTDISFEVTNKERMITVREPDGTLRWANWDERHRMCQLYFPTPGREYELPKMFLEENFQPVLERGDYEFILSRCCAQFDPDDPQFHKFTSITYEFIDEKGHYEKLLSTRFYGTMVFYFAFNQRIDNLLIHYLEHMKTEDAVLLIEIFYAVNPDLPNAMKFEGDAQNFIRHYLDNHCPCKGKVEGYFKNYLQVEEDKKQMEENIKKAHGLGEKNETSSV